MNLLLFFISLYLLSILFECIARKYLGIEKGEYSNKPLNKLHYILFFILALIYTLLVYINDYNIQLMGYLGALLFFSLYMVSASMYKKHVKDSKAYIIPIFTGIFISGLLALSTYLGLFELLFN